MAFLFFDIQHIEYHCNTIPKVPLPIKRERPSWWQSLSNVPGGKADKQISPFRFISIDSLCRDEKSDGRAAFRPLSFPTLNGHFHLESEASTSAQRDLFTAMIRKKSIS
jgi:hypothetical protein